MKKQTGYFCIWCWNEFNYPIKDCLYCSLEKTVITEHLPQKTWTVNFSQYNASDDVEIPEGLALSLLKLKRVSDSYSTVRELEGQE